MVGIGASAGGIEAFKAFFTRMPVDSGMSFILVQHLDPHHESSLASIISGSTSMPVHTAKHGATIEPNNVYVIPPDAVLTVTGGTFHLTRPALPAARRTSVNTFLISLAKDQGENAIGVILSGFGSDGALGIAAIKEHGGLTLSQAEFDHHAKSGMPQSAASSGFVDHVLAVEDMPAALMNYRHHRAIGDATKGPDGIRQDLPSYLTIICAVLHGRLGRDFSQYKAGTLMRRIQRRMHVLQTDQVSAYVEQLRASPNEAELLFRELLISVTRFFRDTEAFQALEESVIPGLLSDLNATEPIRVWIPGCATGEEAYSIAILLREAKANKGSHRSVQIFATDIDDRAIDAARAGVYPGSISSDVSPERLAANFVKEDGTYRVVKELREMCLFSTHDLVNDPPFSRLDLISCRNILIYFEPPLQHQVFATFHYALRPGGHLFLGPSESVAAQSRLFVALDKRHRLYARRDTAARLPIYPLSQSRQHPPLPKRAVVLPDDDIDRRAARAIAPYAPAFLVVDQQHDILRFSGQTAKYLEPTNGVASLNLFALLHTDLRSVVRAALRQSTETGARIRHEGIAIEAGDQNETVNLIVEPLADLAGEALYVIAFQEVARTASATEKVDGAGGVANDSDSRTQSLTRQLTETKVRLRNIEEELRAAHEELQSTNEEYLSVNEELQSTNEELETSKEELQSLNEELQTINAELNHRNDSLVRSNSDLANLLDSTSIATLFLDNDLRIRRFTPRLLEIFKVREGDEGRPITDIVTHLTRGGLGENVQQVLRTLVPVEREVAVEDGLSYLMQVRAYRDVNNVIDGAVVTFVDISERKKHEQASSLLAAIVESSEDAVVSHDLDGIVTSWNGGAGHLFGYSVAEAIGQSLSSLLHETLPDDWPHMLAKLEKGEQISHFDSTRTTRYGRSVDVSVKISPLRDPGVRIVGASMVARDISERRKAEEKSALLLGELDHRVKNILAIVSAIVSQTLKTSSSPEAFAADVDGRIGAIAKAHSLLTDAGLGEMSLRAVIEMELAPYDHDGRNIAITGHDIALTPKAGLAVAMAIHELASNAAKYGALSTPSGRLAVDWKTTGNGAVPKFTLQWTEADGPPVQMPKRRGFGTTLIERSLTHEFDAEVNRAFDVAGLRCTIAIPLTEEVARLQPGTKTGDVDEQR